ASAEAPLLGSNRAVPSATPEATPVADRRSAPRPHIRPRRLLRRSGLRAPPPHAHDVARVPAADPEGATRLPAGDTLVVQQLRLPPRRARDREGERRVVRAVSRPARLEDGG